MSSVRQLLVLAVLTLGLVLGQLEYAHRLYGKLSPIADPWSEANALRAAEGYRDYGFLANAGLPEINFGGKYPGFGSSGNSYENSGHIETGRFIYKHYPPGPDLLLGVMTTLVGPDRLDIYRLFPISIAGISISFFAYQLWLRLGFSRAIILFLISASFPMFTNMMHGLHYQSYAFSLVLVEIALLIRLMFRLEQNEKVGPKDYLPFPFIGFIQGYLSFDHVFLVPLIPFAILATGMVNRSTVRCAIASAALLGGAYAAAHAAHFGQVVIFDRSLSAAIQDYLEAAKYNAVERTASHNPIIAAGLYAAAYSSEPHGFNISLVAYDAVILLLCGLFQKRSGNRLDVRRALVVEAVSAAIGLMWMVAMPAHAMAHVHFLVRNLFIAYFAPALYLVRNLPPPRPDEAIAG